jgi:peptidoglycan/xylan/chitin deacetylase (PgdA/CDA1 family)
VLRRSTLSATACALVAALTAVGCGSSGGSTAPRQPGTAAQAANGPAGEPATTKRRAPVHVAPSRQSVPVLMYHVVTAPPPGTKLPGLWVPGPAFRAQVKALAAAGYTGVTLDTVLDAWRGRARLPRHPIVFSFDDGYLSQGKTAADALAARHWPGVLNLVLHNLDTPGGLTTGRIRAMAAAGWEVDAHTIDHLDLTTLDAAGLRHQIAGSRTAIRRRFHVVADGFCYPAGRFNATVEAAVRAAGFRVATTELPGAARPGGDRYALPRIRVDGGDGAAIVVAKVRAAVGSAA